MKALTSEHSNNGCSLSSVEIIKLNDGLAYFNIPVHGFEPEDFNISFTSSYVKVRALNPIWAFTKIIDFSEDPIYKVESSVYNSEVLTVYVDLAVDREQIAPPTILKKRSINV